jgi:hypothetical protein
LLLEAIRRTTMLTHYPDLFRISAAASDVGVVDWLRTALVTGALAAFVRYALSRLARGTTVAQ